MLETILEPTRKLVALRRRFAVSESSEGERRRTINDWDNLDLLWVKGLEQELRRAEQEGEACGSAK